MLDRAIDAYRAAPLTGDVWFSVGKDAWVRAFALAARRGAGGQSRKQDMSDALKAQVLATTTASASRTRHSRAESISGKTARPRSASPNPLPQSPRLRLSMSQVLVRLKKCPRQESNLRPLVPETNALSPELRRRTDRGYHRMMASTAAASRSAR